MYLSRSVGGIFQNLNSNSNSNLSSLDSITQVQSPGFDFHPEAMHIEEICIEGFKSYAQRTVIQGFDQKFNAITGLNGSGKSNILDSICFVLGITNLQQVRAGNLQDLVYKLGQAGVTKATVSIVFSNEDRKNSPVGFEDCKQITVTRQVVIGGRNKYLINGHIALPSRVQNLFHSVQLNVNNPHFLIMQGRITKVLNMKPIEILSMLEEAAGTRMYEVKKEGALKTLEKKQNKVDEIDKVLGEDILPALNKLRKERSEYMIWTQRNNDIDKLKRFCIAYEFTRAQSVSDNAVEKTNVLREKIEELNEGAKRIGMEIEYQKEVMSSLNTEKKTLMGPELKLMNDSVDELSKEIVKDRSILASAESNLASESSYLDQTKKSLEELDASSLEKIEFLNKMEKESNVIQSKVDELTLNFQSIESEYQGVQTGKCGAPGEEKFLEEKLSELKASLVQTRTESKQFSLKIDHLQSQLCAKKRTMQSRSKEAEGLQSAFKALTAEISDCQVKLDRLDFDPKRAETLEQVKVKESNLLQNFKSQAVETEMRLNLNFAYNDPEKNFDRSRVKGQLARLFKVNDLSVTTALEVIAGSKLYNIVVDDEKTGKLLLQKGGLKRRVTIIPLNKIEGRKISASVLAKAVGLVGENNVKTALSFINYTPELEPAMAFAFGNYFICKDSDTAKKIAFHPSILLPCVSLEGDLFSPNGLLTGGSRNQRDSLLLRLNALNEIGKEIKVHETLLKEAMDELNMKNHACMEYKKYANELELKTHRLNLLNERMKGSEYSMLAEEISGMESEVAELAEKTKIAAGREKELHVEVCELESEIANRGSQRNSKMKFLENKLATSKKLLADATKELKAFHSEKERHIMDIEACESEKKNLMQQITSAEQLVQSLNQKLMELSLKFEEKTKKYENMNAELKEKLIHLKECEDKMKEANAMKQKLEEKLADELVEVKKITNQCKRMEDEKKESEQHVIHLIQKHAWIESERSMFGLASSAYDFEARSFQEAKAELEEKSSDMAIMEKRVNKKVMSLFEKAEEEYQNLMTKKQTLENDKSKIIEAIHELDEKKKEALEVTWKKVNKDFGSIFSTLLPGTKAKLEPPEGETFLAGLEVKVAFGSVWKQSLSELSGGQRSLLALSLILSLLLFKPAPIYILDEVDAALDLSHTQNIGRMIKTHFPHSQFIVVSLKEGMFSNANVIFTTKFVDGVSTVTRKSNTSKTPVKGKLF